MSRRSEAARLRRISKVCVLREGPPVAIEGNEVIGPAECAEVFRKLVPDVDRMIEERIWVMMLGTRNQLLAGGLAEVARGGVAHCTLNMADVFRPAVVCGAVAIILIHNHPSGDATPSAEDIALTKRTKQAGELLMVRLLDHLIVAAGPIRYLSLRERGDL